MKKVISTTIDREILKKVDELKWALKLTRSQLVETALREYIERQEKANEQGR